MIWTQLSIEDWTFTCTCCIPGGSVIEIGDLRSLSSPVLDSQNLRIQDLWILEFLDLEILTRRAGKGIPYLASEMELGVPRLWEKPAFLPTWPMAHLSPWSFLPLYPTGMLLASLPSRMWRTELEELCGIWWQNSFSTLLDISSWMQNSHYLLEAVCSIIRNSFFNCPELHLCVP